ncbi:hypothetical protein Poly51_42020 [Rubripirellula tenax]|uniref:Chromosome partition protein Smc n=1 Tax=Rubripirellula tenax TaxID=2528015 RepID=A0A5C6ETX1_9BACT|nr:hypothetical protein [Rubripirellula tenax]TWU50909.1 hypothetical protein Poly51_42020 [Rubripirellula tenax]
MTRSYSIALAFFAVFTLANFTNGQGGMGGGGFGGNQAMEVVILLGEDYDYQSPPFVSAQEIVRAFGPDHKSGTMIFDAPTLASVRVDVTSRVPKSSNRSIVAEYPNSLAGAELDQFKKKSKLNALRFGINDVEFVEVDPKDEYGAENGTRLWLREPYVSEKKLQDDSRMLSEISRTLAAGDFDKPSTPVRLDLFAAMVKAPQSYYDMGMDMMGMESGMGMGGGMGMDGEMDMAMGRESGMGMGAGMIMGPLSHEQLSTQRAANDTQRAELKKRIESIVAVIAQTPDGDDTQLRRQLAEVATADLALEQENESLEVQIIQSKLEELRDRIERDHHRLNRDETIRQRVDAWLSKRE